MGLENPNAPIGLAWRSSTLFVLVTVGTGIFTDLFLYSIIVPIIPFILEDRLGVARSNIQTYTSALLASWAGASFLSSPPIGILADRTASRKLLYMFGIGCLFLGTGLLWAGQAIWVLILARVVQAISGSVVYIVGLSLLVDTIGSNNLGMALGTIFSIVEISQLIAPVIGGSLYAVGGEASVFGLTFGILALDFLMRLLLIDRKTAAKFQVAPTIPSEGLSEPSLAVTSEPEPSLEVLNQPVPSETTPLVASTCSAEWIIAYPPAWIKTFPMGYCIRNPRMIAALATTFAQGSLISMFEATMTIEAQELFDVNSLKAGLLFIPLVLPSLVTGPFSGRMMDKFGPKPTAVAGFFWVSIALLLFRIPGPGDIGLFCGFLALTGGGLGMIGTPSILEGTYVVENYHKANPGIFGERGPYGQLYALNGMGITLGMAVGPLVGGALRTRLGFGDMCTIFAVYSFLVGCLCFIYTGGAPRILQKNKVVR